MDKNTNLSRLITALQSVPKEDMQDARRFLPLMILRIADEDLERLGKEYGQNAYLILKAMLLFPKDKWKELGIPNYMMKYEIEEEE
ncbi:MAG: hypothetical protein GXO04_02635 [Aquificae bacterium]|nr:hypothetical protein [Aquificota bacterium]